MRRAVVLSLVAAAVLAGGAVAKTPLPPKPQGSGAEPTAGGGVMGSARS